MKTPFMFSLLLGLLILAGFLRSQPKPSKFKVVTCYDVDELVDRKVNPRNPGDVASFKTNCDRVLNAGGQPVLYMGRGSDREHLFLMKTQ